MVAIVKAKLKDAADIVKIGKMSFLDAHKSSASAESLQSYLDKNFTVSILQKELTKSSNLFYLIYYKKQLAGYSKIILNENHPNIKSNTVTKLERLYLLKAFYDYKLGYRLLQFNVELSKKKMQSGMWLFVWTENERAINFYKKTGFTIVGQHDFKISPTHSNPNHQLLLNY